MGKLVISEWVSLDGVFDADTMADWFQPFESAERGEVIKGNVDAAGAFLMGRITYQMLASYWPQKKHNEDGVADRLNQLPKYVVSETLESAEWNNSRIIKSDVANAVRELKQASDQELLVFGSAMLVRSLMKTGLVDELRILVHPVIAGTGRRFYRDGMDPTRLELLEARPLSGGVLFLRYGAAS